MSEHCPYCNEFRDADGECGCRIFKPSPSADLLAQYHRMLCRLLMELGNEDQITDWQEWELKVSEARRLIEKGNALNLWEADANAEAHGRGDRVP